MLSGRLLHSVMPNADIRGESLGTEEQLAALFFRLLKGTTRIVDKLPLHRCG